MIKILNSILFCLLQMGIVGVSSASDIDIDLVGCQPDGIISTYKERFDPKGFWVKQHVALEMSVERKWEVTAAIEDCRAIKDDADRTSCVLYHRNRFNSILKCLQHAKIMCRKHGGFC